MDSATRLAKRKRFGPCRVDPALTEKNIGKVVKIQVFSRVAEDEIDLATMSKYVGVLKSFSFDHSTIEIRIDGLDLIHVARHYSTVEVFQ